MTITPKIQQAIDRLISTVQFPYDPNCTLTPLDHVHRLEADLKKMFNRLAKGKAEFRCPECGDVELLNPAHETPMHRHGKVLHLMRRATA